jgi:iron complex outermembrane receptor protein
MLNCAHATTPAEAGSATGIQGQVTDPSGAAIGRVHIAVRGSVDRQTVSDELGRYRIEGLRSGGYQVIAEKAGFAILQHSTTIDGSWINIDLRMEPQSIKQSIEVVASADLASESVMKMSASLHETPRALSAFSGEELRERNVRSVAELLAFVPGMSPNSFRNGGYHFYARGFRMQPDDTRVDGFPGVNLSGGFGASMFGVEQAVVLRGPAGLLYGSNSAPGGLVNLISKRPQPVRSTRLDLRAGSFAGTGVSLSERPSVSFDFDSTGAVTGGERILYRALFTAENQNYFTRGVLDRHRIGNLATTFKLDSLGLYSLTPVFQFGRELRPAGGGIVVSPTTSLSTNDGISGPINVTDLSPHDVNLSAGLQKYQSAQTGFDFRAVPTRRWTANLSYRFLRNDRHINQWTPQVISAAQLALLRTDNQLQRLQSKSEADNRFQNIDFNTSYEFEGSSWRNTVMVGAYNRLTSTRSSSLLGAAPAAAFPVHIYTGFGVVPEDRYPSLLMGGWSRTRNWNGYFQNRASLLRNRLVFTLGLGYGQSHPYGLPTRKGDLMPNYSALFNVTQSIAIYGSYSTSYNPIDPTLQDASGRLGLFDPTMGKNFEYGVKFDTPVNRISSTISYFRNSITNALVQTGVNDINLNGVRYYVEAGARRGKGVEWSFDTRIRRDAFLTAAVSYIDAIYTGSGPASAAATLAIPGSKAEKTPKWAWNARANYERSEGRFAGIGASLGFLWQDQRLGSNGARAFSAPDPLILPAYLRTDAALSYRINRNMDVALNVENLMDRRIYVNATTGSSIETAPPRTVTIRIGYRF